MPTRNANQLQCAVANPTGGEFCAAMLIFWLQESHSNSGGAVLIGFLLLLLVGGTFLVSRGVIDLMRDRKGANRQADADSKKVA